MILLGSIQVSNCVVASQYRLELNQIDLTGEPIELIMYVRNISDVVRDTDKEFFTINLISREAFEDQTIFLKKMYPKDVRISDHVKKIIDDSFENATVKKIDPTLNQLGFHGNQKHPMETLFVSLVNLYHKRLEPPVLVTFSGKQEKDLVSGL